MRVGGDGDGGRSSGFRDYDRELGSEVRIEVEVEGRGRGKGIGTGRGNGRGPSKGRQGRKSSGS